VSNTVSRKPASTAGRLWRMRRGVLNWPGISGSQSIGSNALSAHQVHQQNESTNKIFCNGSLCVREGIGVGSFSGSTLATNAKGSVPLARDFGFPVHGIHDT
jgi:hypothetical protein